MSVTGIIEAMRTPRRSLGQRLVWQCLENHANGQRFWRMTEADICAELRLSRSTVARAIAALVADKVIEVDRFKRRPSVFRMQREYAKPNGSTPHPHAELRVHNDDSTPKPHAELRVQKEPLQPELRVQKEHTKTPPERIHQKEPSRNLDAGKEASEQEADEPRVSEEALIALRKQLGRSIRHVAFAPGRPTVRTVHEQIAAAEAPLDAPLPPIHPAVAEHVLAARRELAQRAAQRQSVAA